MFFQLNKLLPGGNTMAKKRIIIGRTAYTSYNTPQKKVLKKETKSKIIDFFSQQKRKLTKSKKILLFAIGITTALSTVYMLFFIKFLFVLF